jgi:hypothetical protein
MWRSSVKGAWPTHGTPSPLKVAVWRSGMKLAM